MKSSISTFSLVFEVFGGIVVLFILAPIISLILSSSNVELVETIKDKDVINSIWLTLTSSMIATLILAVFAIPLAYLLARKNFVLKKFINGIVDLPIVIPHSAAGLALLFVLSSNSRFGIFANSLGIDFIGNQAGIVIAMAFVSVPFLINAAREGFTSIPLNLEQAAMNLGASEFKTFRTISLPLAKRSIITGLIMMWARGMSEFGAVVIIAYHPMITPVMIYERFGAFGIKYARPIAVIFIIICLLFFVLLRLISKNKKNA